MKKTSTLLFIIAAFFQVSAQTKTSVNNGDWYDPATWNPSGVPDLQTQQIIINSHVTFAQSILIGGNCDEFRIESGATLTDLNNNDTLIIGSRIFRNNGAATIGFLSGEPSDSTINNGSLKVTTDYVQSGVCLNTNSGIICVTNQLTTGDDFINNGDVSAYKWINGASVNGTQGQFCVADWFINGDQINGTVDICDATPGTQFDVIGLVGNQVTFCSQGPCGTCAVTSIDEFYALPLTLFPNPVTQGSSFYVITEIEATVTIFDAQGKVCLEYLQQPGTHNINTASFTQGIYFLTVRSNKASTTQKIVIH
jgi:hypothetical protein